MLKFLLLVNKQGQARMTQYYEQIDKEERPTFESDVIKKCLSRDEKQCSFFEYKTMKIVYRRYTTLYFIIGIDEDENELAVLEFIHNIVEAYDKYFDKVCELDIMFNLDKAHMLLNEMVINGRIVETNRSRILAPLQLMDQTSKR